MEGIIITEKELKDQEWKYYFVLIAWPAYLFSLFFIYSKIGLWSIAYMIFPGLYIFTWLGYLMHETWHKYVPGVNNGFFYYAFSVMLFTDPQVYKILHGFHHSMVNTYEDNEFHPFGRINNRFLRAVNNIVEIILGIAYLSIAAQIILPRHPKYSKKFSAGQALLALFFIALFLSAVGAAAMLAFNLTPGQVAAPFLLTLWLNSFFLHQSQLVEHGNLIAEGTWDKRNILTRNLKPSWPLEKLFLFMTHGDSQEHVLHHTQVGIHSRPFPGRLPLPAGAVEIDLGDYMEVLGEMVTGKETVLK
jgi:fatty acid desaturase